MIKNKKKLSRKNRTLSGCRLLDYRNMGSNFRTSKIYYCDKKNNCNLILLKLVSLCFVIFIVTLFIVWSPTTHIYE